MLTAMNATTIEGKSTEKTLSSFRERNSKKRDRSRNKESLKKQQSWNSYWQQDLSADDLEVTGNTYLCKFSTYKSVDRSQAMLWA